MKTKLILFTNILLIISMLFIGCANNKQQIQEVQVQTLTYTQSETVQTMFFDLTVNSAQIIQSYDDYVTEDANYELVLINVTIKNNYIADITMADSDITLKYGDSIDDIAFTYDAINDRMMPLEQTMLPSDELTYDLLYAIPKGKTEVSLWCTDIYNDGNNNDITGDSYCILLNI